jgi:hypothetical protein
MDVGGQGNKRPYIHRKRYLKDCILQIKTALEFVRLVRQDPGCDDDSYNTAVAHGQSIEAVCWSPHSRMSPERYQQILIAKTQELCCTIIRKALPSFDFSQLQRIIPHPPDRRHVPHPTLVVPKLPMPKLRGEETPLMSISSLDGVDADFPGFAIEPLPFMEFGDWKTGEPPFESLDSGLNEHRSFF